MPSRRNSLVGNIRLERGEQVGRSRCCREQRVTTSSVDVSCMSSFLNGFGKRPWPRYQP